LIWAVCSISSKLEEAGLKLEAIVILTDRYAGHFTFGMHGSWWDDELGYKYSASYTDASCGIGWKATWVDWIIL